MHFNLGKPKESSLKESKLKESKLDQDDMSENEGSPPSYLNSMGSSKSSLNTSIHPPIHRQSSSSLLRGMSANSLKSEKLKSSLTKSNEAPKKKNVPYRPAPEQQKFIDNLDGSGVTSLSAVGSTSQTEYFDVLPSFQMFQSILKRDDQQFSENLLVLPPQYGDTHNSSPTPPDLSPVSSAGSSHRNSVVHSSGNTIDGVLSPQRSGESSEEIHYNEEENYGFGDDELNDGLQTDNSAYYRQENISNAHDTYGHTVLDNIDKLQKLNTSPIDIQIYVTKRVPVPNTENELETRLKEYSNGDLVNGYVVLSNTSDKPISFGLFTVSLEGTIKAAERKKSNDVDANRFSKILMKKFLKMYDLNASYGYTDVPNSAGIEYEAFTQDTSDECILGLPNERVLQPHTKYKKFFTFKFPNKLLDNTCSSGLLPHVLPPPSMGVDRTAFNGRADNIELNKALGYGFLGARGTPVLTRDYSFDDLGISYSIEAKFIDKLNSSEDPLSHDDINDANNEKDYVISKSGQYFLRFVPDLKDLISYYNEEILLGKETYGSIGIDGKLFANYMLSSTWKNFNVLNSMIEEEIDARLIRQEFSDEDIKHKNLIVDNYNNTNTRSESLLAKEENFNPELLQPIQDDNYYHEQRMIGSRKPVDIFGKKKKKILSSLVKVGHLKVYVRVPNQPITYCSPKLMVKYNKSETYDHQSNELMPVNSITNNHINELYHRVDDDIQKSLKVVLQFDSIEPGTKPPEIESIECNIVAWSFRSDYPLPCTFEYDFFYDLLHHDIADTEDVEITKANLQQIKDQTANYIQFLKANKTYISKNSYLYLKSMKTLGIKRDTISEYFKPIRSHTHPEIFKDNWKGVQQKEGMRWTKPVEIPLDPINKHNINLIPSFQSCLIGRLYCLQVMVKYKGGGGEKNEFADNVVKTDVPVIVG